MAQPQNVLGVDKLAQMWNYSYKEDYNLIYYNKLKFKNFNINNENSKKRHLEAYKNIIPAYTQSIRFFFRDRIKYNCVKSLCY